MNHHLPTYHEHRLDAQLPRPWTLDTKFVHCGQNRWNQEEWKREMNGFPPSIGQLCWVRVRKETTKRERQKLIEGKRTHTFTNAKIIITLNLAHKISTIVWNQIFWKKIYRFTHTWNPLDWNFRFIQINWENYPFTRLTLIVIWKKFQWYKWNIETLNFNFKIWVKYWNFRYF